MMHTGHFFWPVIIPLPSNFLSSLRVLLNKQGGTQIYGGKWWRDLDWPQEISLITIPCIIHQLKMVSLGTVSKA
jgi:hypothetical protein